MVTVDVTLDEALAKSREIAAGLALPGSSVVDERESAAYVRKYWNEGGPSSLETISRSVQLAEGAVEIVLYRPKGATGQLPAFIFLHGGGFRTGSQWANDRQMREIAAAWGGVVVSADYVHVPEHVFPEAVNQTAQLLEHLHLHGDSFGIDGDRIAFGGCSAGASISFGAAISLGRQPWLRGAVGIVGAFSGDTSTASMLRHGNGGLFPDRLAVAAMFNSYLPDAATRHDPRANTLFADPEILPTTFVAAAELDVFLDASAAMARSLASCGRLYDYKVYPGMAHLFFGFSRSVKEAQDCVGDIATFLRAVVPAIALRVKAGESHVDTSAPTGA